MPRSRLGIVRRRGAAGVIAFVLVTAGCGLGGGEGDEEEERPVSAPPRVSVEAGETVVRLDAEAQAASGLALEALRSSSHQPEAKAYGSVLDLTELAEGRGAFQGAAARLERTRAALLATRAELERTRVLHADQRTASDKALEAATAAFQVDEADLRAAEGSLEALAAGARQRWGEVIAGWLEHGSDHLESLLAERERLVQLTLPAGSGPGSPPSTATVRIGDRPAVEARLVSPAPRADPRLQGVSFLYRTPSSPALVPGARVVGSLPEGPPVAGVAVPASAVVWWQGKAWVYLEKAPGRLVRRELATDAPLPDGWFAAGGFAEGERVVVRGAQLLLSEEGRGAVHGSEG